MSLCLCGPSFQYRLEGPPDRLLDDLRAGRVRMDAVAVVQMWNSSDAVEKEWHEDDVMRIGQGAECLTEFRRIHRAVVRWCLHPRQNHRDAALLRTTDDPIEVLPHLRHRQPAQAIVGAQLDDEHIDVTVERPVQPAQPARRRVARDAGVHHFVGIPFGVEPHLNQRWDRLLARESQTGGQAVAEKNNACAARRGRGRGR